jgi:hypothetical protein
MTVSFDVITRKKLILVRQLYQRAIIQADARHSYVDRIMALIGFDLTIETILKAIVSSLNAAVVPKSEFQAILQQADNELANAGLPAVPDKAKIQHVRTLRNDAQHKAKNPNDADVSDCRTYTRDFLVQMVSDVWGETFESLSLTEIINDYKVKGYLVEAEIALARSDYQEAIIKSIAALSWTLSQIQNSIVGRIPYYTKAIVVTETFTGPQPSSEIFNVFMHMRDLLMRSIIGLDLPSYLRYKRITRSVARLSFAADGSYWVNLEGHNPEINEADYVIQFAINAVIQIESLVGDINKPFEIFLRAHYARSNWTRHTAQSIDQRYTIPRSG